MTVSLKEFIDTGCQIMCVEEFVEVFFGGGVTKAAEAFNVSRVTMHSWMNNPDYEIQVVYHEFPNGKKTYDYILKKQVKRVGAIDSDFFKKVGYVYAISNGSITKVGASTNPKMRARKVARDIGFEEYQVFISNPTDNYLAEEKKVHAALSKFKRENTIYQREVFSCQMETVEEAIRKHVSGISSGPRESHKGVIDAVGKRLEI